MHFAVTEYFVLGTAKVFGYSCASAVIGTANTGFECLNVPTETLDAIVFLVHRQARIDIGIALTSALRPLCHPFVLRRRNEFDGERLTLSSGCQIRFHLTRVRPRPALEGAALGVKRVHRGKSRGAALLVADPLLGLFDIGLRCSLDSLNPAPRLMMGLLQVEKLVDAVDDWTHGSRCHTIRVMHRVAVLPMWIDERCRMNVPACNGPGLTQVFQEKLVFLDGQLHRVKDVFDDEHWLTPRGDGKGRQSFN